MAGIPRRWEFDPPPITIPANISTWGPFFLRRLLPITATSECWQVEGGIFIAALFASLSSLMASGRWAVRRGESQTERERNANGMFDEEVDEEVDGKIAGKRMSRSRPPRDPPRFLAGKTGT